MKVKAAEITSTDMYHLGFTMRFPRALQIRDDLSIADCMTASGERCANWSGGLNIYSWMFLAVLEGIRSEKKRKMEDDTEYVYQYSYSLRRAHPWLGHHSKPKKKQNRTAKKVRVQFG